MAAHVNVTRRRTMNAEKDSAWAKVDYKTESDVKGIVSYAEYSMLNSILSRTADKIYIPKACHFDEGSNVGRVHGYHHNQGVYALSRRITRSIAPSGVTATDNYPAGAIHHVDPPSKGELDLRECHMLSKHLMSSFGVTNLLPRSCTEMLEQASAGK
eukprot:FR738720.1.p1 GENE.FR738720.1~~FR738720.1.p1  ORF type:complete len:164 (+),score=18.67 FR738720.1:23-493(+)